MRTSGQSLTEGFKNWEPGTERDLHAERARKEPPKPPEEPILELDSSDLIEEAEIVPLEPYTAEMNAKEQAIQMAEVRANIQKWTEEITKLEEPLATQERIRDVNAQIDESPEQLAARLQLKQRALMEREQTKGTQQMAETNKQIDAKTERTLTSLQAEREREERLQRQEEERNATHLQALAQAKSTPTRFSDPVEEKARENAQLLSSPADSLIFYAKDVYGVTLSRDGKPSFMSKLKGLFGGNKSSEADPLFQSIKAELEKRSSRITSASKK